MRIFVAGATGAIGRRLVPLAGRRRHPVVLDALDRHAVREAPVRAEPQVLVHQLTALAGFTDFRRFDEGFFA